MFRRNFLQIAGVGLASTVTGLPSFAKEEKPKPLCTGDENLDRKLLSIDIEKIAIRISAFPDNTQYLESFIENLRKNNDETLVSIIQFDELSKSSTNAFHCKYDIEELKGKYNFVICQVMKDFLSPYHFNVYPHSDCVVCNINPRQVTL